MSVYRGVIQMGDTKILVIDDEETMLDACGQVLSKQGYEVFTASSGEEGLKIAKEIGPDIAIVDLKMPGIDGMEVLERLDEIDPSIVKIVITGYATVESAVDAMKRGAYDFLPKPFTPDELRLIVRRGLERRRLEAEREALREERDRLKADFITIVSHQLKSPLVAIKQYLEAATSGAMGEISRSVREVLERCSERTDELLKMLDDWLNMSRIEAGKLAEKMVPINPAEVLDEAVEELRPLADGGDIRIIKEYPEQLPRIIGDFDSLKQAFSNIISNGIRYNRPGGNVRISTRATDEGLFISVSDTGIGISEEDLPYIFDEFFRVRSKERPKLTGSGLGLSIAKKIIEAHSGSIDVRSKLGEGTTFIVRLPRREIK
jgi:signal transduction histidine kinase